MQPLQAAPMVPNASQRSTSGDTQATTQTSLSELQALLRELSGPEDPSTEMHVQQLAQCAPPQPYFSTIMPPVTDVQLRKNKLEAPYLRELRKRLDSGTAHTSEVDAIAENLLEDAAFLAADYLGNSQS